MVPTMGVKVRAKQWAYAAPKDLQLDIKKVFPNTEQLPAVTDQKRLWRFLTLVKLQFDIR